MIDNLPVYLEKVLSIKAAWVKRTLHTARYPEDRMPFPARDNIDRCTKTAWFRGHAEAGWKLRPKVFRDPGYDEVKMNLECRRRASLLPGSPRWGEYAQWLCLMQHHGLPTRLLDWTESALAALYFAVEAWREYKAWSQWERFSPVVWMLNPYVFNWVMVKSSLDLSAATDEGGGTEASGYTFGYGMRNFVLAFDESRKDGHEKPMAILPAYVHTRMQVQQSRFTIHGRDERSLEDILAGTDVRESGFLERVEIDKETAPGLLEQLTTTGTSRSTLFPDLDGIARELSERFARGIVR